jgi:hypothetical protein
MTRVQRARAAGLAALTAAVLALAGCGGNDKYIPVEGQVLVGDQPLTAGTVVYHPNAAKGNTSMHEPRGEIDANGHYKLVVGTQAAGAPPGAYLVTVFASVKIRPQDPYSPEKLLTNQKYADKSTSKLEAEVRPGAPPGAYDFKLEK